MESNQEPTATKIYWEIHLSWCVVRRAFPPAAPSLSTATAPQRAPSGAHPELQTHFLLTGRWWVPEEHPWDQESRHTWQTRLKTSKCGGHDFTSCILQSWVFYCNYVLATNCRRGKWLRVLLSLRIQHKSHRAAVAEMMKYLYCCFSITGVSWHKKRFPCIALMCKCALIRAAGTWSHIQEEKQLAGHFLFTYL